MTTTSSLVARRDRALGAGAQLFYNTPLQIVRGDKRLTVVLHPPMP